MSINLWDSFSCNWSYNTFHCFFAFAFRLGACDYDDKEKREECREKDKIKIKKFNNALKFVLPLIATTIIVLFLGVIRNKKYIILHFICILIKIFLFTGYIILICIILKEEDDSEYIFSLIIPEVISDIFFLVNAVLICFIKKIF